MRRIVSTRSIIQKAKSRPVIAVCTAALTITAIGGVASAAIPNAVGVINGCYDPRSAYVRVVDAALGQTCTTAEKPLNWNQTGPQGPAGPTGPQGPAGPAGGYNRVGRGEACAGTCTGEWYSTYLEAWAGCPSGMTLVGGGFEVKPGRYSTGQKYPVQVQKNAPYPGYDYWVVGVNVQQLSYQDLKVYAMCVAK
jgi:hypothetical protein